MNSEQPATSRETCMAEDSSDRIIDRHERRRLLPCSDNHVLRVERAGRFPARVKLGSNRVGWLLSEFLTWIDGRKADRQGQSALNERSSAPQRYARRQH
jgi:prophage regulatory protein